MCVKFLPGDLNPDLCPPHLISTYTYGVTITLRMYGDLEIYEANCHIKQLRFVFNTI